MEEPLSTAAVAEAASLGAPGEKALRVLRLGRREIVVRPPGIRDPRSHVAFVLLSVQALGQIALGFELSIAQILLSIGTCALISVVSTWRKSRILEWPASAMLTGNGIALVLRVNGTDHGDWWSLKGWHIYVATCVFAMASKALFRSRGRHIFNPSNLALVVAFLILGSDMVEPLDFWWGPMSWGLAVALVLVAVGGSMILWRGRLLSLALSFWAVFAGLLLLMGALGDHCMTARWSLQPMCGTDFARVVFGSPETVLFAMFMVTDPRTVPITPRARRWFGPLAGVLAGLFVSFQTTEFAHKVGVLAALTVVFALTPVLERRLDGAELLEAMLRKDAPRPPPQRRPAVEVAAVVVLLAMAWSALGAPSVPSRFVPSSDARARSATFGSSGDLPETRVDANDEVATRIPLRDARQMVSDTLEDLAELVDAVRILDLKAAKRYADGPWLDKTRGQIDTMRKGGPVSLPVYDIEGAVVSVARRSGQAAPALMVTLHGTSAEMDARTGEVDDRRSRVVVSVEIQYRDSGRYVIVTDKLPEGFVPPN
ncbi:MAG: RnfABCDGE type electron transport complex subunit D [Propionibacteriaceae bacterium]|nr:RnfABCDGE type electron transport complex subunit D [Propionibacteriaceae bacterium]